MQLLMFEEMGCTVNHESDVYKTFQLAKKGVTVSSCSLSLHISEVILFGHASIYLCC